jgi:hypothetical protein
MATNKKLRAFARFDGSGRVIPGSMVMRKRKPKVGRWQEITAYECCGPAIPPTVSDPVVGAVTSTTIDITWMAAVEANGQEPVTHYVIKQDTVQVAIVAAADVLAYTYTGLTPATSYDLTIEAVDANNTTSSGIVAQATTA